MAGDVDGPESQACRSAHDGPFDQGDGETVWVNAGQGLAIAKAISARMASICGRVRRRQRQGGAAGHRCCVEWTFRQPQGVTWPPPRPRSIEFREVLVANLLALIA